MAIPASSNIVFTAVGKIGSGCKAQVVRVGDKLGATIRAAAIHDHGSGRLEVGRSYDRTNSGTLHHERAGFYALGRRARDFWSSTRGVEGQC